MRRRRPDQPGQPGRRGPLPGRRGATYADILAQLDDPDGLAPALGAPGGPVELRDAGGDRERWVEISTYPVARRSGLGRPAPTRRSSSCATSPRHASAQAVRETFIGVLSHELRTPVTTIFGGAKLLAREPVDARRGRPSARSSATSTIEAERLQRLVEDVVALNRFGDEARRDRLRSRSSSSDSCRRVVGSEEGAGRASRSSLDIAPGLPTVIADPTYVEQVVRNLLSNAAKYGGRGSDGHVAVEADGGEVAVRILDDGPGFPADEARAPVRAVLPLAGNGRGGGRRRDRAVRLRAADRGRWAAGSGPRRARAAAPSSGSRCTILDE